MKIIESILREEKVQLEKIIKEVQKRLKTAPPGHLRITKKRNMPQYYYKSNETGRNGRYIKKDETELVRGLAQKDYDICMVKNAQERVKAITTFLLKYENTSLKQIYRQTNQYRRALIDTPVISDEEYIKRWQSIEYKGKQFAEEGPEIMTERGERVRSKSEKIIADKLYMLGIPYRYEYPIILEGRIKIYPDFTILRMPAREEVYLEHFGMMGDSNYVENMLCKLNTYEKNEIYIGVNLFVTFETSKKPLNTRALDKMLKKLFLPE